MGCHFLLQGIFPTQGSNPDLLHCRQILYSLSHQRSPPGWWGVSATMAQSNSSAVLLDSRVRKAKTLSLYVWKEYRCPQTCQNQISSSPSTPSCSWLLHFTTFTFKSFFFLNWNCPATEISSLHSNSLCFSILKANLRLQIILPVNTSAHISNREGHFKTRSWRFHKQQNHQWFLRRIKLSVYVDSYPTVSKLSFQLIYSKQDLNKTHMWSILLNL